MVDLSNIGSGSSRFNAALQEKYRILGQEANASTTTAGAAAMNANTNRMALPSEIGLRDAQAGLLGAQTLEVAPDAASNRNLQRAQADRLDIRLTPDQVAGAFYAAMGIDGRPAMQPMSGVASGMIMPRMTSDQTGAGLSMGTSITDKNFSGLSFAKGTAKVPGKGTGKVDTVPAKLAPGEAVLNKAAAEAMGRGLIAALNAAGARKMGMV